MPSSSGPNSILLRLLDHKCKSTIVLQNEGNCSHNNIASHHRRAESSATPL